MKAAELAMRARAAASDCNTIYIKGGFGAPITEELLSQMARLYPDWYTEKRLGNLRNHIGKGTFGFDCVCFLKGILWGWCGDAGQVRGGAVYQSNGVPDFSVSGMQDLVLDLSYDFGTIEVGEVVFLPGHVGIYVGDGLCAECTTAWGGGVLLSACNLPKEGYPLRRWTWHGKLRYLEYEARELSASLPRLEKGVKNSTVSALQLLLNEKTGTALEIDGSFGRRTAEAVLAFQLSFGLAADGVMKKDDWEVLLRGRMKGLPD